MKSIVILGDGMSDRPQEKLGGRTPLMAALTPSIDEVARRGRMGTFSTIPTGMPLGSAVANLSVFGYDPRETFQGRGVLEAASLGVELEPGDVAMRINLLSLNDDGTLKNHHGGHITTGESSQLIEMLQGELGNRGNQPVEFHLGNSYRHILVCKGGWASAGFNSFPPHDHIGQAASELMWSPADDSQESAATAQRLVELYNQSGELLASHPVNLSRREKNLDTAIAIWPWSPGLRPSMRTMNDLFGISGSVISAVDLVRGLGRLAGLRVIKVDGVTGLWDTNYEGKVEAALKALETDDFVFLHLEATDEASHAQDLDLKIKCIEYLDQRVVGPVLAGLEDHGIEAIVSILPDHPTFVSDLGKHGNDPVPVAIWDPRQEGDGTVEYNEDVAKSGSLGHLEGDGFISRALGLKGV
ncbi:MAG: cofactor-independent phosphoglycerate mutase [Gemmatimonadales bacterium]|nr:cofactor-independent phosphoglycerate mutase [Gemmatimonadales bacterium]